MIPSPPDPDFSSLPAELLQHLDARFHRLPFERVRTYADYWALRDVETDHVRHLARRFNLTDLEQRSVEHWWLRQLVVPLDETLARLRSQRRSSTQRLMRRRRVRSKLLFQLWFNTAGPGGRTWLGNRYTTIRHYTFRLHWRP